MSQAVASPPASSVTSRPWTGKQLIVLLVIGVGALMVSLTQSLLVPVLSQVGADLHASGDGVAWLPLAGPSLTAGGTPETLVRVP